MFEGFLLCALSFVRLEHGRWATGGCWTGRQGPPDVVDSIGMLFWRCRWAREARTRASPGANCLVYFPTSPFLTSMRPFHSFSPGFLGLGKKLGRPAHRRHGADPIPRLCKPWPDFSDPQRLHFPSVCDHLLLWGGKPHTCPLPSFSVLEYVHSKNKSVCCCFFNTQVIHYYIFNVKKNPKSISLAAPFPM